MTDGNAESTIRPPQAADGELSLDQLDKCIGGLGDHWQGDRGNIGPGGTDHYQPIVPTWRFSGIR